MSPTLGKIFGLQKNYLIVEAQYKEGEAPKPAEADDNNDANQNQEDNGKPGATSLTCFSAPELM